MNSGAKYGRSPTRPRASRNSGFLEVLRDLQPPHMGPQSFHAHCLAVMEESVNEDKEAPVAEMMCRVQEPEKGKVYFGDHRPCNVVQREAVEKGRGERDGLDDPEATLRVFLWDSIFFLNNQFWLC